LNLQDGSAKHLHLRSIPNRPGYNRGFRSFSLRLCCLRLRRFLGRLGCNRDFRRFGSPLGGDRGLQCEEESRSREEKAYENGVQRGSPAYRII
jgi:hypothetical protein